MEAGVNAADAAVGEVSALRLPQLAFEGSATRYQEPMIVAPLHALDITRAPDFDRTLLRGTASVAYTLFDGPFPWQSTSSFVAMAVPGIPFG